MRVNPIRVQNPYLAGGGDRERKRHEVWVIMRVHNVCLIDGELPSMEIYIIYILYMSD